MSEHNDPLAELDAVLEKARALIPRGGSARLARKLRFSAKGDVRTGKRLLAQSESLIDRRRGLSDHKSDRLADRGWAATTRGARKLDARKYLLDRSAKTWRSRGGVAVLNGRRGVYKSLDALAAEINKAAMRFADGSIRRMSMRQRRNIRTQNATDKEYRAGTRTMEAGRSHGPNKQGNPMKRRGAGGIARQVYFRRRNSQLTSLNDQSGAGKYNRQRRVQTLRSFRNLMGVRKAKPKTLYVYRPVENAEDIIAWAKAQGFGSTLAAVDLHVTIAFSKTPLNWAKLGDDWCAEDPRPNEDPNAPRYAESCVSWSDGGRKQRKIEGGAREVKALGDKGAVVLAFQSPSLTERWAQFVRIGASWDYAGYTPHVSISYSAGDMDLSKVEPYRGPIILGEEDWNEIEEGAGENIAETPTGADVKKALESVELRVAALEKTAAAA